MPLHENAVFSVSRSRPDSTLAVVGGGHGAAPVQVLSLRLSSSRIDQVSGGKDETLESRNRETQKSN